MAVHIQFIVGTVAVEMDFAVEFYIIRRQSFIEVSGIFGNNYFTDVPLRRSSLFLFGGSHCLQFFFRRAYMDSVKLCVGLSELSGIAIHILNDLGFIFCLSVAFFVFPKNGIA
jgi:hypothetical protein